MGDWKAAVNEIGRCQIIKYAQTFKRATVFEGKKPSAP